MAPGASQIGLLKGIFNGGRRACAVIAILVTVWPAASVNATPLLAQAGAALIAPPLDKAAKPANAPAGGAPAASAAAPATWASSGGISNALLKYGPIYALMALLIGLGVFIICRPKPTATKAEK